MKYKLVIIILITAIICSSYNIFMYHYENIKTNKVIKIIKKNIENDYSNETTNGKFLEIPFGSLKEINEETKGWIVVNNTNINYPFVQAKDNSYYLNHSFDKTQNSVGWLFMDYRNSLTNLDKNTIIYAHNRKDKSMFGSLKNTLNKEWLNNKENHFIKISTEYDNSIWQVFSIYHIPTTNDYIKINFIDNKDFLNFIKTITERSIYNFNVPINETDNIITLSTCHGSKEKLVLHAKLIEKETR